MTAKLVKDVMHRGVITCLRDKPLKEVARLMVHNDIREVVVVDESLEVFGVISDCLLVKAFGRDLDKTDAEDILLPYTIDITPGATLAEAIELMRKKKIRSLVVVEGEGYRHPKWPVAILSCTDIIEEMAKP